MSLVLQLHIGDLAVFGRRIIGLVLLEPGGQARCPLGAATGSMFDEVQQQVGDIAGRSIMTRQRRNQRVRRLEAVGDRLDDLGSAATWPRLLR